MSMIFILVQNKFDIDLNNDELLETIWKKELIIIGHEEPKLGIKCAMRDWIDKVFNVQPSVQSWGEWRMVNSKIYPLILGWMVNSNYTH